MHGVTGRLRYRLATSSVVSLAIFATVACQSSASSTPDASRSVVVRITGSDTMVNLNQAWSENYAKVRPDVSVQVAGGGSGVGIAGLIDGILDIAASSREMDPKEVARATAAAGVGPKGFTVGLDALAVFVHGSNPLDQISIEELADVYGEGGPTVRWSQLGVRHTTCPSDRIIRVSRQSNSGTYVYFQETILGRKRELALGSIDQSGSKDVVTLVSRTPCAIGYSGMAYAANGVKTVRVSKGRGEAAITPTLETALDGTYPIARPLFLYTRGEPQGPVKAFIEWTLGEAGQQVVQDVGFVPAPRSAQ